MHLRGRILALVSCTISASCTTHIGGPPYPLHTPSIHPRLGMAGWAGNSQHSEWSQRRLVTTIDWTCQRGLRVFHRKYCRTRILFGAGGTEEEAEAVHHQIGRASCREKG